jgi:hypothetical protein
MENIKGRNKKFVKRSRALKKLSQVNNMPFNHKRSRYHLENKFPNHYRGLFPLQSRRRFISQLNFQETCIKLT